MVRSGGKRSNTRHLFKRSFRKHGPEAAATYLRVFKVGQCVDIVANSAVQQGMPFKYYHGKTGRIFNISRTSVGVEILKAVGNRCIPKRFHLRIEHVRPSRCQEAFKDFIKKRDADRRAAKASGEKLIVEKRQPKGPNPAKVVDGSKVEFLQPIPYEFMV
mmetsp:Transcript_9566/g.17229  ORF Transcript_9566/g.17229 Transcript_9566/m.17229 type:complete len:160 (-) Transcript_9566:491-970(-)|eukprot:CAMPEP_0182441196 /NCGR_PEP_ID=MMETSP1172-20130603/142_1 /TAXON_ID=708627 /ORGANISM="Timspurckia oligopyrenoides, Strain CCMP3278" /LENGTH=159 /DNA_ID=CAMNT_0024635363 /DNA_START=37 /DNA_END=516 /DNA_ORIENTATION=+